MRHWLTVVGAVVIGGLVLTASVGARQRPSFSGHWVLADQSSAYDLQLGREFSITQSDAAFLIDRNLAGAPPNPALMRIYYLSAAEVKFIAPPAPPRPRGTPKGAWTLGVEQVVWSAQWSADQLVIVQKTSLTVTTAGLEPPVERRLQTFTSALSLDRDGSLVVNRTTTLDPSTTLAPPAPSTIVYKKI